MVDDAVINKVIESFGRFEFWNPWHDFKFAEAAGLNMTFFLPAIRIALGSKNLTDEVGDPTPELELRILDALRDRARRECGLVQSETTSSTPSFFPDPDFDPILRSRAKAKRSGDVRKYSEVEIEKAARELSRLYPDLYKALTASAIHNAAASSKSHTSAPKINSFNWLLEPIQHAVFKMYPDLDFLDNHRMSISLFYMVNGIRSGHRT